MAENRFPKLEYLDIDLPKVSLSSASSTCFGQLTPLVPCARCGGLALDVTRDFHGKFSPEGLLDIEREDGYEPLCDRCVEKEERNETEAEMLAILERKLGLRENDRDALRSFIETVFTDPKKILKLQDVDNRVASLEKQINVMWGIAGVLFAAVIAIAIALVQ